MKQDTIELYRYPDLTTHAEFLYEKIDDALECDVHSELVYLQTYDRAKSHIITLIALRAFSGNARGWMAISFTGE